MFHIWNLTRNWSRSHLKTRLLSLDGKELVASSRCFKSMTAADQAKRYFLSLACTIASVDSDVIRVILDYSLNNLCYQFYYVD